ncbi:MAG: GntR family transcriptional regulator [Treponema sp.]|jgi:DNA-binding GntR family transcriptional regulator|nr:GntR family transcriptional regulator [Treponema sp.]
MMIINKKSPIPVYHQLTLILRKKIISGDWAEGAKIPKEESLASEYGVSRVTVRQALDTLEKENLISRKKRLGTFVQKVPQPVIHDFSLPSVLCAKLGQRGISFDSEILDLQFVAEIPEINTALKLTSGQSLAYIKRLFFYNNAAIALNESWISRELVPGIVEKGLIDNHLSVTLAKRYNLSPVNIQNTIEAISLGMETIPILGVSSETPIMAVTSISFLPYEVPLEYSHTLWRGDLVKFSFAMK